MDFDLTPEQRDLQRLCRQFADEVIEPYVMENRDLEWEGTQAERFPTEVWKAADEVGLRYMNVPEKYGGDDFIPDVLTQAVILEELSTADQAIAVGFHQLWKGCKLLREYPPSVQEEWFSRIVEEPTFVMAHLHTEPRGASDRWLPYNEPEANLDTTAVQDGDEWVINGQKIFASNSYEADLYTISVNTNPSVGIMDGTSALIVPRDAPGLEIGQIHESMGHRFMGQAEVLLNDVRVPEEYLLIRDTALRELGKIFVGGRVKAAAPIIGTGRGAYEAALRYAQERVQGGVPIAQHQMVKNRLAEMAVELETARTIVWRAAEAADRGRQEANRLAILARIHAAEATFDIARNAMEIHGGAGVMRAQGVERYMRDAATSLHLHGTQDIHKLKLANIDLGEGDPGTHG